MSFGYSIGDLIGGANMTYKLIRIMSDTRGACVEYQEAMAELCAMQQAFIQVSQMSAHNASDGAGILPLATVNSASFIVMSSMDTIAAFLERTKRYQRRLSKEGEAAGGSGGIEGSWCKMGWALFKKEELRELRDSLHARLASINTLLTAAHHIHRLPASVAQFQVAEYPEPVDDDEAHEQDADGNESVFLEENQDLEELVPATTLDGPTKADLDDLKRCVTLVQGDDSSDLPLDLGSTSSLSTLVQPPTSTTAASPLSSPETPATPFTPDGSAPSLVASLAEVVPKDATTSSPQPRGKTVTVEDLEGYVQNLVASARRDWEREQQQQQQQRDRGGGGPPRTPPKPSAAAPRRAPPPRQTGTAAAANKDTAAAAPVRRRADDDEWRRRVEDLARVKAEIEIRNKLETERLAAEAAQRKEEARKKAEEELRKKYVEEGMLLAEANRKKEEKAPIKFKDAVGRKFNFPFHQCQTWQGMEELIKQAFMHVEILGPAVQKGYYDIIGPNGEIVLPALWEQAVQPDWSVTMHMWPVDRLGPPRGGPRFAPGCTMRPAPPPPGQPPSPPPPPPPPPATGRPHAQPHIVNVQRSPDGDSMLDKDKRKKKGGLGKLFEKGKWWKKKRSSTDSDYSSDSSSIMSSP